MPRRSIALPRLPKRLPARRPGASAPVAGVRIGATHVAVAAAVAGPGPLAPRATASAPLPPGAVRDGEVVDAPAVATALREALAAHPGLGREARIGVGGQKVAVRVLDLPPVDREEDVVAAVRALARERIPTAAEDALVDFRLLPAPTADDGERPGRRALVVAARRELVDGHVAAVRAAGLQPVGVDLLAFGLARCAGVLEPTLLLDLDGVTTFAVASPDGCRFVRTIPAGVGSAADEVVGRTGQEPAAAEAALLGGAVVSDDEARAAAEIVARTVRAIASTVRTSIDFHVEHEGGDAPLACLVSGPLAAAPGVEDVLREALALPIAPASALSGGAEPVALGLSVEELR